VDPNLKQQAIRKKNSDSDTDSDPDTFAIKKFCEKNQIQHLKENKTDFCSPDTGYKRPDYPAGYHVHPLQAPIRNISGQNVNLRNHIRTRIRIRKKNCGLTPKKILSDPIPQH
jgi:hypothetical protein